MRLLAVSPVQAVLDSALFIGFLVLIGIGMWAYYAHTTKAVRNAKHDNKFLLHAISKIESDLVLADQDDVNVQNALSRIYGLKEYQE
jgi:hypothetical protein